MNKAEQLASDAKAELAAAKAIVARAKADGESLSPAQRDLVEAHMAKARVKAEESKDARETAVTRAKVNKYLGKALTGDGNGVGFKAVAQRLANGETRFTVPMAGLLGKGVTGDGEDITVFEAGGTRMEGGIRPMPMDERWIYPLFPQRDAGNALVVQEFVQTAREALESGDESGLFGDIERDPVSTDPKAELNVEVDLAPSDVRQVAILVRDVPNALLEDIDSLAGFLAEEMRRQLQAAIDAHVVAAITDAGLSTSSGSADSVAAELRYAKSELAAAGLGADLAILRPESAAAIDVMKEADLPARFPYDLTLAESAALEDDIIVDRSALGVLYLGGIQFATDPYTGFGRNTTSLRAEGKVLFVVRNKDAGLIVEPAAS